MVIPTNPKANILIDNDGRARLTDFGLASIIRRDTSVISLQEPDVAGTGAWAAPEVLWGGASTKEGDIFTFAMVAVEVCATRVLRGHSPSLLPLDRHSRAIPHLL